MKRYWCCRDLTGDWSDGTFVYEGVIPPTTDDDGNWQGPTTNNDWMFYSISESKDRFGDDLPELDKGERIEIRIKTTIELV